MHQSSSCVEPLKIRLPLPFGGMVEATATARVSSNTHGQNPSRRLHAIRDKAPADRGRPAWPADRSGLEDVQRWDFTFFMMTYTFSLRHSCTTCCRWPSLATVLTLVCIQRGVCHMAISRYSFGVLIPSCFNRGIGR